jgi:hypothetical protein
MNIINHIRLKDKPDCVENELFSAKLSRKRAMHDVCRNQA